jgi:hypothetical protein
MTANSDEPLLPSGSVFQEIARLAKLSSNAKPCNTSIPSNLTRCQLFHGPQCDQLRLLTAKLATKLATTMPRIHGGRRAELSAFGIENTGDLAEYVGLWRHQWANALNPLHCGHTSCVGGKISGRTKRAKPQVLPKSFLRAVEKLGKAQGNIAAGVHAVPGKPQRILTQMRGSRACQLSPTQAGFQLAGNPQARQDQAVRMMAG